MIYPKVQRRCQFFSLPFGQAVANIVFLASPKKTLMSRIDYGASVI